MAKITQTKQSIDSLHLIHKELVEHVNGLPVLQPISPIGKHTGSVPPVDKKREETTKILSNIHLNIVIDELETVEDDYNLSVVGVLNDYYADSSREEEYTKQYYRVIIGENFIDKINDIIHRVKTSVCLLQRVLAQKIVTGVEHKKIEARIDSAIKMLNAAFAINVEMALEKRNYEVCKCGTRMTVFPELSELHCPNITCGKVRAIIGAVFRDDQFYPQDGQKSKHGGYDTSRHYRFWIERIQGTETKTFLQADLNKIEYVIRRDRYDRKSLTCEIIRTILKDSIVGLTTLNDHATLLVKTFGGPGAPRLDFLENRLISMRFNKAMRLYDIVVPGGGNKPYYPYFIYKIIEHEFRDNPDKLRLLDFIHLQSRETVIKNDKIFDRICKLADKNDGLVYKPTDPGGRV